MHIASNIRFLRNKRGLTQADLARELSKTSAAISDYEKGKSTPPLEVISKISQFFRTDISDLVNKDLRKIDLLNEEGGLLNEKETEYLSSSDGIHRELQLLRILNQRNEQRIKELEREIREHAPELARRLELLPSE